MIKPLTIVGWFFIDTLYGLKDRQTELTESMVASMDRVAEILEVPAVVEADTAADTAAS